jgi:hypothetical protein
MQASDVCIQYALNHNQMDEYYKHKIAIETLYPHAEAYITMKYEFCMIREE